MYSPEHKIMFAFSQELDTAFLQEMYGDDLQQAEMVFESSAQQLRTEISVAEARYHDGDTGGLKKAIHKMKPLFGYVGQNEIMSEFAAFEDVCMKATDIAATEKGFDQIKEVTRQAIQKIELEVKRLKQYNNQYL